MEKVAEVESSINRQMLGLLNRSIPGGILAVMLRQVFLCIMLMKECLLILAILMRNL